MTTPDTTTAPALGVIYDEPIDTYHATMAWSKTKLDVFHISPAFAHEKFIAKNPEIEPRDSDAFKKGRAVHALVLEGERVFTQRYCVVPEFGDCRKAENKLMRDNWRNENAGKEYLTPSEWKLAYRCKRACDANPALVAIIAAGKPEVTFRAALPSFTVQARPDIFVESVSEALSEVLRVSGLPGVEVGEPLILDLKTTATLNAESFGNFEQQFFRFGYFRSAPFYNSVVSEVIKRPVKQFIFAAVETGEPNEVQLYSPSADATWAGFREVVSDLNSLAVCIANDDFPSHRDGRIHKLGLPEWFANKLARKEDV